MGKYVTALYRVLIIATVVIFTLHTIYSVYFTIKACRLEKLYSNLLHERNLIDQNYSKMRREFEEKEQIYRAQEEKLQRLEEAKTIDDYIRLWKG